MPDSLDCIEEEVRQRIADHVADYYDNLAPITVHSSTLVEMMKRNLVDRRNGSYIYMNVPIRVDDSQKPFSVGRNPPPVVYCRAPDCIRRTTSEHPYCYEHNGPRKKHRTWWQKAWIKCRWQLRRWKWEYGWGDW